MKIATEQRRMIEWLIQEVGAWPQIEVKPHPRGGTEFALGKGEIGHIHPDGTLDVPFPKRVRDELITRGEARVHHWVPDSGWVTSSLRREDEVPAAVALLRRSYELRLAAKAAQAQRRS